MELQVGVKALLKNKDKKYLLLRRSREKYPEIIGEWDIVGGRIDPGSTLLDNLKREISEETKLALKAEPKLIAAQDILNIPNRSDRHVVRLTYLAEIDGEPQMDGDHIEFGWFTLEEMKNLDNLDIYFKGLLEKGFFND